MTVHVPMSNLDNLRVRIIRPHRVGCEALARRNGWGSAWFVKDIDWLTWVRRFPSRTGTIVCWCNVSRHCLALARIDSTGLVDALLPARTKFRTSTHRPCK